MLSPDLCRRFQAARARHCWRSGSALGRFGCNCGFGMCRRDAWGAAAWYDQAGIARRAAFGELLLASPYHRALLEMQVG